MYDVFGRVWAKPDQLIVWFGHFYIFFPKNLSKRSLVHCLCPYAVQVCLISVYLIKILFKNTTNTDKHQNPYMAISTKWKNISGRAKQMCSFGNNPFCVCKNAHKLNIVFAFFLE